MTDYLITGARSLIGDALEDVAVRVEAGRIAEIGSPAADGAVAIDGRGLMLAPALVDIHGDAFERQIMPRPSVFFPLEAAILDTDRQLAANGIATAYHALTLSWEPGLRSVERGEAFIDALSAAEPRLSVENRIQLRWETFAFEATPVIERALALPKTPSIAFNDHTSMSMRSFDVPIQERLFEHAPDYALVDPADPRMLERRSGSAKRAGLEPAAYIDLLFQIWERRPEVPGTIAGIAEKGRAVAAPLLSHDDTQVETRRFYRDMGATISEFPMRVPVAEEAKAAGDAVIYGAPNAVRGGSHIGSPATGDMVEAGLCDIMASDYYYPAMLAGVARLHAERRAPLPTLWRTVSTNPARASGLADRGEIAVGQRADLVLVDWPDGGTPRVVLTLSAGKIAYQAGDRVG